jgi:hypothetical protein
MASALSQGRMLRGCVWRYRAEGDEEVRRQRVCAPGKERSENRTPASKALRDAGIARFDEEGGRSEKDENTLAAGSQGGVGAAAGALARSAVVPVVTGKAVPVATDKLRVSPKSKAIEAVSIVTKKVRVFETMTDAAHEIGFSRQSGARIVAKGIVTKGFRPRYKEIADSGEIVAVLSAGSESDARDIHAGGKEGVCRADPSATMAEKAPEDLEGLPPLKKLRFDVSEREAYLKKGLIKWFEEHCGFFRGTVRAYDTESDVYKIAYATDDEEDMSYEEVKSLVLKGTGGGSTEVVSSYGSWWVAAENDTPRRIVAELAKRGSGEGPGRGALQAEQIVELNRRQYPALLVTSKLRKNTLVFLGAGGGSAVGVDAGSGGGTQDTGAVSVSLDACKQLPPAPMSPSRDTGVGGEGDGADDMSEGSNVGFSLCWGSRPGGRSAEGVAEPEPEMQGFHVVVPENVKPGQQFCARIGTDGPLMSVFCPENCWPGTTLQVRLPKVALPRPKNPGAVQNARQASSGGGGGYSCSRSPLTTRKSLAPSFKGAGIGSGMGAMCSAFPFQRRLLEEASGASVGATVAEAQARTRVSVAFDGGEDEAVRCGGGDVVEGQGGVDEIVRCSRPRDAPKGREGGGGDVSRVLGADVGIDNECVMCMDAEKSHAFVPCGHMCVCKGCAGKIMGANKECPFCCSVATAVMRVFT